MPVSPPEELIESWLQYLELNKGRTVQTTQKYGQYLRRLSAWASNPPKQPHLAPRRPGHLLQLDTEDLRRYVGVYAHHTGLSAAARRPLVSAVRAFYKWAHDTGHLPSDPGAAVESPRAGRKIPRVASLDWVAKLLSGPDLETFRGVRDALIIALLAGCGMRVSGVCNLNESSLLWTPDERGIERLSIRVREKGKKERLVPAPDEVAMLMRAYLAHPDLQAIDRSLPDRDQVLIVSTAPNGTRPPHEWFGEKRRMGRRSILWMIEKYAIRLGLDPSMAHPHALRHLYGTELAESDIDVIQRQALLGHEDARTTAVYTHLAQRKLRATVDKANPLQKMRAPLLDSLRALTRAAASKAPPAASAPPNPARNAPRG